MARRGIWPKTSNVQRRTSNVEFQKFCGAELPRGPSTRRIARPKMIEPPYRTVAVASTFSPRFLKVLSEAKRIRDRLGQEMHLIFVGSRDEATSEKFTSAIRELDLPADSPIHYQEGDPAD